MATHSEMSFDENKIIEIFANDAVFCKNWKLLCTEMGFSNATIHDLENAAGHQTATIRETAKQIMSHWKSILAVANPALLSLMLWKVGFDRCAEEIENLCLTNGAEFSESSKNTPNDNPNSRIFKFGSSNERIWFNIRSPKTFYFGREYEMARLRRVWNQTFQNKLNAIVAIKGVDGIGKSELVRNYAKYFYETVHGHCIWIEAETIDILTKSFQNLATKELKISLKDESGKNKDLPNLIKATITQLLETKCLIIFHRMDSWDVLKLITNFISKQPPTILKPLVILTCRKGPPKDYFESIQIKLNVLTEESVLKFFVKTFKVDEGVKNYDFSEINDPLLILLRKLCARLHYYPLAVQLAGSYIKENLPIPCTNTELEMVVTRYLKEMEAETKRLLDCKLPQYEALEDVYKTSFVTWKVTFDAIKNTPKIGKAACQITNIISFLFPENISYELIAKIFQKVNKFEESENSEEQLKLLNRYSMLNFTESVISVHRLLQEMTKIGLQERNNYSPLYSKILTSSLVMLKTGKIPSNQIIHFETIWLKGTTNTEWTEELSEYPNWICKQLYTLGRFDDIHGFTGVAINVLMPVLGKNNRWTMRNEYWEGCALEGQGEYQKSLEVLKSAYEKQKRILGEEDEHCLNTHEEMGDIYWRLENFDEALHVYENALAMRYRVKGEKESRETLGLRHQIATVKREQEKFEEAMKLYKDVLRDMEEVLGLDHRDTLSARHNIAFIKLIQKEYEEALRMFNEVVEAKERVLGENHHSTLITKHYMAVAYKCLGRYKEASQFAKQVYDKRVEILGSQHPHTIFSEKLLNDLNKMSCIVS